MQGRRYSIVVSDIPYSNLFYGFWYHLVGVDCYLTEVVAIIGLDAGMIGVSMPIYEVAFDPFSVDDTLSFEFDRGAHSVIAFALVGSQPPVVARGVLL